MRFLLAAARGKWFRSMHTAAILGNFPGFRINGPMARALSRTTSYNGLYMATLLSAFHIFSSWKKVHHYWGAKARSGMRSQFSLPSTPWSAC